MKSSGGSESLQKRVIQTSIATSRRGRVPRALPSSGLPSLQCAFAALFGWQLLTRNRRYFFVSREAAEIALAWNRDKTRGASVRARKEDIGEQARS